MIVCTNNNDNDDNDDDDYDDNDNDDDDVLLKVNTRCRPQLTHSNEPSSPEAHTWVAVIMTVIPGR